MERKTFKKLHTHLIFHPLSLSLSLSLSFPPSSPFFLPHQVCTIFVMIDIVIETDKLLSPLSDGIQLCYNLLNGF